MFSALVNGYFEDKRRKIGSHLANTADFGDPERTRTVDLQRDRLAC